jgi:DNA-binding IclR family transcriptional regulator
MAELLRIRNDGYATDNQEHENEICCIAAPIWDNSGSVNAALSISAVRSRMELAELQKFTSILMEKSQLISKAMGYQKE